MAQRSTIWTDNPVESCQLNYKVARELKRNDLAKMWKVCARIAQLKKMPDDISFIPWTHHTMGKALLKSLIDCCIKNGDFQTSATILCSFWPTVKSQKTKKAQPLIVTSKVSNSRSSSAKSSPSHGPKATPYLTIHGQSIPENDMKVSNSKKSKFWFMKPGALHNLANSASPYHTIQLGTQVPPTSRKIQSF